MSGTLFALPSSCFRCKPVWWAWRSLGAPWILPVCGFLSLRFSFAHVFILSLCPSLSLPNLYCLGRAHDILSESFKTIKTLGLQSRDVTNMSLTTLGLPCFVLQFGRAVPDSLYSNATCLDLESSTVPGGLPAPTTCCPSVSHHLPRLPGTVFYSLA